uniref:WD-repeat protein n=1 Tax=Solanum tuberosum TaxID=4113 RepID=M1A5R7_SOLTU
MIAAISWVPKGVAKSVPAEADPPTKEEIEQILKSGLFDKREDSDDEEAEEDMNVDESEENEDDEVAIALAAADALGKATQVSSAGTDDIIDGLKELDMDNYDEEEEGIELFGSGLKDLYYASNDMDPYLKDKDNDSEEDDDMIIRPDDFVIVCASNEDDLWGSMEPAIEIWDIDIIDEVQPSVILGGIADIKRKGKKKSIKYKKDSHKDAVLGLSWNKEYRNILASASADHTVKVWDVTTEACNLTMNDHTDKVQAVAWNPFAPQILLSGSFDHTVCLKDGRKPSHSGFKFSVGADVESLAWDPHSEHSFVVSARIMFVINSICVEALFALVSLENGTVTSFDIRAASSASTSETKPSFTIHAHDKAASSLCFNPLVPNLLATGSTDKMGAVFTVSFSDDCPFFLAIGGSKGKLQLWDISSEDAVLKKYGKYVAQKKQSPKS